MRRVRIAFPEMGNEVIKEAVARAGEVLDELAVPGATVSGVPTEGAAGVELEAVPAGNLEEVCAMVASGVAEGMIAGIDYTSREVILAARDGIGMTSDTFSASFVLTKDDKYYVIGDAAACKNPTEEQLYEITLQTYETAQAVLEGEPKVAMLSFSTLGSGGSDPSMERAVKVIERVRTARPEIQIDGEMQLDAAVNPRVAEKKAPGSHVAGRANVLILPDLNSGNILYKAMEQFGGFTAAGPILQGFNAPCSDLSRGSTVDDVLAVIEVVSKQILLKRGAEKEE